MRKNGTNFKCTVCGNDYYVPQWRAKQNPKYCSYECYWNNKHDEPWNKGTKGIIKKNGGSFGNGETSFKGELSEYKSIHHWIRKTLGKPKECSRCGKIGRIEWANKSGEYKREVDDWLALCRPCHYIYDKTENRRLKWHSEPCITQSEQKKTQ